MSNSAINADVQKRRFALLLHAGYGERYVFLGMADLAKKETFANEFHF